MTVPAAPVLLEDETDDEGSGWCLNANVECSGPVEYHFTGSSTKAWPRCDFHQALREAAYENSMERYADSDVAPSWFDPSVAGERWDED